MNANEISTLAARAGQLAAQVNPSDSDPCAQSLKLAVYHLRSAATKLQQVAEFKAEREKANA